MSPATTAAEIMQLFARYGDEDYDGEPVSQTSHMIQCGMLAERESGDPELVVGAFLHDVGHLLKHTCATPEMDGYGAVNHEGIGAAYLRSRGFSSRVCAVVEGHVAAKRYLVATNAQYKSKLSPASLHTLQWQGGPMSSTEIAAFWNDPHFNDIVAVRLWDERAKLRNIGLLPLHFFETSITQHLTLQQHLYATNSNGSF